ncbi:hypothetical protein WG66_001596 [Moniliophthora roreri]|nr:hypothetical protein WG66_001596 [Moniliophthora roreri]
MVTKFSPIDPTKSGKSVGCRQTDTVSEAIQGTTMNATIRILQTSSSEGDQIKNEAALQQIQD